MWQARRHLVSGAVLAVAVTVSMGVLPAVALSPVKVVGGPNDEYAASSNGTYLTWTSCARHCNVYVKALPDGAQTRVNPKGTDAGNGYFIGTSNVLVYDQGSARYRQDIFFYDVGTGTRTRAPLAISRPKTWEWAPAASDQYVAFMRVKRSSTGALLDKRLLLYDRTTGGIRTLMEGTRPEYGPQFAGSEFVLGFRCSRDYETCGLWYWSEATGRKMQPGPPDRNQSPGFLDEATGDLYFMRSRTGCGQGVTFRRGTIGSDTSSLLASLPQGMDVANMSLATNPGTGNLDLHFTGWHCRAEHGDIYMLQGVNTV